MTDEELKNLIASLAIDQKENARRFRESQAEATKLRRETELQFRETELQFKETAKQLKELGRQIGGLGNKFGSFTEGLALPSMTKILQEKLGMAVVAPRVRARKNGKSLELDVLAYSNGEKKAVYIVEVKSHAREDSLEQLLDTLRDFSKFFPDHADKKLYGILAAVDISDNMKLKVLESGIYLANIQDEHFKLQVPKRFKAKNFQANSIH